MPQRGDVSVMPQEDFLPDGFSSCQAEKAGCGDILILCWKHACGHSEKNGPEENKESQREKFVMEILLNGFGPKHSPLLALQEIA